MGLFTNLFGYRRTKRYDFSKTRKDSKLNGGFNYQALPPSEFIGRSLSGHIQRNETIQHFLIFLDDYLFVMIKGVRTLKGYKNYTVKKGDKHIR